MAIQKKNKIQLKTAKKAVKKQQKQVSKNALAENLMCPFDTEPVRIPDGGDGSSALCTSKAVYDIDFNLPNDTGTANRRAEFVFCPFVGQSLYRAVTSGAAYSSPYLQYVGDAKLKNRNWTAYDHDDFQSAIDHTGLSPHYSLIAGGSQDSCLMPAIPQLGTSGTIPRLATFGDKHVWASAAHDFNPTGAFWGIVASEATDLVIVSVHNNSTANNYRSCYYYTDDYTNILRLTGPWQTGPSTFEDTLTVSIPAGRVVLAAGINIASVDFKVQDLQWSLAKGHHYERMDLGVDDMNTLIAAHPNGFKARTVSGGLHLVYEGGELYGGNVTGARYGSDYDPFNGQYMTSPSKMTSLKNTYSGRLNDNFMAPWTPGSARSYKKFRHVSTEQLTFEELNDSSFCKLIATREDNQSCKLHVIHTYEYLTEKPLFAPKRRISRKGIVSRALNMCALLPDGFANDNHETLLAKVRRAESALERALRAQENGNAGFLDTALINLDKIDAIFRSGPVQAGAAIAGLALL